jgi:hypothetical protein
MVKTSTSFKPGQSGNPNGRPPKEWSWSGLLREMMDQTEEDGEPVKVKIARALKLKAFEGDVVAIKELGNRIDGMPKQAVEHSGEGLIVQIVQGGHQPETKNKDMSPENK